MTTIFRVIQAFVLLLVLFSPGLAKSRTFTDLLSVPDGFKIELFADGIPNARTMVMGDQGTLFIGSRTSGTVTALKNGKRFIIARNLNMPNGLAFYNKALYIAAVDRILRLDNIEQNLNRPPRAIIIRDDLPKDSHHGWRFIAFGPDKRLYISIGAPCNVCLRRGYAQIRSMKADGSDEKVVAEGVRNSVGFAWHPLTQILWFSDNGRDWLGDDSPPDELNRVARSADGRAAHFGFPYCHGGNTPDPDFKRFPCSAFTPPALKLGAHVAPLGIAFYTGKQFPSVYENHLFVAEHGSWNRSKKTGYRVAVAQIKDGKVLGYKTFVSGWLQGERAWGRPAYLLVMRDGSLLISDDKAGAIYRVSYKK